MIECTEGNYLKNDTCFPCFNNCKNCESGSTCKECIGGY